MDKPRYQAVYVAAGILRLIAWLMITISCLSIFAGIANLAEGTVHRQLPGLYFCLGGICGFIQGLVILVFRDLARATVNTADHTAELVELLRKRDQKPASGTDLL